MRGLRIGIFLGQNLPSYYAHSINVMKMAQGFKNVGCNVEVITADSQIARNLSNKIANLYDHYGVDSDLSIRFLPSSKKAFENGNTQNDPVFCHSALKYAKEKKFDFVYCRNLTIPFLTASAGIPTFVESHHTKKHFYKLDKIYSAVHLNAFKGLVTIHHKIKEDHISNGIPEEKIIVLEDGVDFHRFALHDDKQKWRKTLKFEKKRLYAVYCGSLYPEKGIEFILQAAKKMMHLNELFFILVGGPRDASRMWNKYCKENGIDNVIFTGFVPNSKIPKYLKMSDCLLMPYQMKNMDYRIMDIDTTSPLKMFEYMASKRPIIATNIPTISKVLKHEWNALLVPPDNLEQYCKEMLRILKNPQLGALLSSRALKDVQKFSWDERCEHIVQYFIHE